VSFFTTETPRSPRLTEFLLVKIPERVFSVNLGVLGVSVVTERPIDRQTDKPFQRLCNRFVI